MIVLVLTQSQADALSGETTPGHALEPVDIGGGAFILPLAVLADPAHAAKRAALDALARIEYTPPVVLI